MHFFLVAPPLCTWVVERTLQKQATYSPHQHHLLFWPEFDQKFLAIEIGLWRLNIEMIIIISFHHHVKSSYLSSSFRKSPSKGDTNLHYFSERKAQAVIFLKIAPVVNFLSIKPKLKLASVEQYIAHILDSWKLDTRQDYRNLWKAPGSGTYNWKVWNILNYISPGENCERA